MKIKSKIIGLITVVASLITILVFTTGQYTLNDLNKWIFESENNNPIKPKQEKSIIIKKNEPVEEQIKEEENNPQKGNTDKKSNVKFTKKTNLNKSFYYIDGRDGKKYESVQIGSQVWLSENLNIDIGSGCSSYDNKEYNSSKYGRLYTWQAAKQLADNIEGWHLPTDNEWKIVETYLGMSQTCADGGAQKRHFCSDISYQLKTKYDWKEKQNGSSGNGDNSVGFSALPGGYQFDNGDFYAIGEGANFWSASSAGVSAGAWNRFISYNHNSILREGEYLLNKNYRLSVRLIKD